jgi:adenylate cyclase
MRRNIFIICLLSFIYPLLAAGQSLKKDSLVTLLSAARADTNKVNLLISLGSELMSSSPQEALDYSKEAIGLALKLNFQRGLARANKNAGLVHYFKSEFPETIKYWDESRRIFESIGDKAGIANIASNMGAVYNNFGEDNKALELFFQSQKAAVEIGDSLRLATTMINIGLIYLKKEATLDKAIEIYLEAYPIAVAIHDYDAIGTAAVNLGDAYFKKGKYPEALIYYNKSITAFESASSGNVTVAFASIGRVYAKEGEFEKALENQNRALEISERLNAKLNMVLALLGLADTYNLKGDAKSAILSLERAQKIGLEINANFELQEAYKGLAKSYATLSDFSNAYRNQVLLTDVNDILYRSSNDNMLDNQQLSFDLAKKEGELKIQELAMQKQRVLKNSILAGLILIIIIAFIILRNYLDKVRVNRLLDKQNAQIESLLLNILPAEVARELQDQGSATPRDYQSVSVLFTDFKDFTRIAGGLPPNLLVAELNEYFNAFDTIIEKHNLEKIKTIGDAYMCAGGIPSENNTHPVNVVQAGLDMQEFMRNRNLERAEKQLVPWGLRVGIHTGPVVAGVVGRKKYAYDIWGNTVNIASRMESNGEVGKVNISAATYELVRDTFNCEYRGKISAKNVGEIDMYYVDNKTIEIINPN